MTEQGPLFLRTDIIAAARPRDSVPGLGRLGTTCQVSREPFRQLVATPTSGVNTTVVRGQGYLTGVQIH